MFESSIGVRIDAASEFTLAGYSQDRAPAVPIQTVRVVDEHHACPANNRSARGEALGLPFDDRSARGEALGLPL
jgi:hypothetical protein